MQELKKKFDWPVLFGSLEKNLQARAWLSRGTYSIIAIALGWFVIKWICDRSLIEHNFRLAVILASGTFSMGLCSASELAISGATMSNYDERGGLLGSSEDKSRLDWNPFRFLAVARFAWVAFLIADGSGDAKKHNAWANSLIVLINTLIVVAVTYFATQETKGEPVLFSVGGVTLLTVLVGEIAPKLIAVKYPEKTLKALWWWIAFLFLIPGPQFVALGLSSSLLYSRNKKQSDLH